MEKDVQCQHRPKKTGVATLISDKIYFRTRNIIRDKKGHCIVLKESILQEDKILNVYAPCKRVSNWKI